MILPLVHTDDLCAIGIDFCHLKIKSVKYHPLYNPIEHWTQILSLCFSNVLLLRNSVNGSFTLFHSHNRRWIRSWRWWRVHHVWILKEQVKKLQKQLIIISDRKREIEKGHKRFVTKVTSFVWSISTTDMWCSSFCGPYNLRNNVDTLQIIINCYCYVVKNVTWGDSTKNRSFKLKKYDPFQKILPDDARLNSETQSLGLQKCQLLQLQQHLLIGPTVQQLKVITSTHRIS